MSTRDDFDVTDATSVVTTTYVTLEGLPILFVTHEEGEDGIPIWQFHADNGDYGGDKLQLVRLDTILALHPDISEIALLPLGYAARRATVGSSWSTFKIVR